MAETKVNADLRQHHLESYFCEYEMITRGMQGDTDPQEIANSLVIFAKSIAKSGLSLKRTEFDRLADEFSTTIRINKTQKRALSATESNGAVVRAAIRAGIVDGIAENAVGDSKPYEIQAIATDVATAINEAYTIPKN